MYKKPSEYDPQKAEFARLLGKKMEDRGWNQSDLARAAEKFLPKGQKFRRDNIHVYLNQVALPRPKQLIAIAKALDMSPEELLPGVQHARTEPSYSMQPVIGEPGKAHLRVTMKVPMRTALAVLSILEQQELA